jgi:hypothetical protein
VAIPILNAVVRTRATFLGHLGFGTDFYYMYHIINYSGNSIY